MRTSVEITQLRNYPLTQFSLRVSVPPWWIVSKCIITFCPYYWTVMAQARTILGKLFRVLVRIVCGHTRKGSCHEKVVDGHLEHGTAGLTPGCAEQAEASVTRRLTASDRSRVTFWQSGDLGRAAFPGRKVLGFPKTMERHAQHLCQSRR